MSFRPAWQFDGQKWRISWKEGAFLLRINVTLLLGSLFFSNSFLSKFLLHRLSDCLNFEALIFRHAVRYHLRK